jgi:streptogramin lyase
VVAPLLAAAVAAAVPSPFAGGHATSVCGSRSIPFQQAALAAAGGAVWVACRDGGRLIRVRASNGARVRTVRLPGFRPWAVASGFGSLWAIDRDLGELRRLDPRTGRQQARLELPGLPVAVWAGAGSVWIGFESGTRIARVDPRTNSLRLLAAGDGASGFATDGRSVFVVGHRDNSLTRIDLASGRSTILGRGLTPVSTTATERVAYADGSLWVTGRGLDLLRLRPATGSIEARIEIGPAAFEVLRVGTKLLVAAYTERGAAHGDPIVGALETVDPETNRVEATRTTTRLSYLSGLVVRGGIAWAADTVLGRLTRVALP